MYTIDKTRLNQSISATTIAARIVEKFSPWLVGGDGELSQEAVGELTTIICTELEAASALTEQQESRTVVSGIVRALRESRKGVGDLVVVTEGEYEGRVGYFDDETEDGQAIVYLGKWQNGYVTINKDSLAEPTAEQKVAYSKRMSAPDYY